MRFYRLCQQNHPASDGWKACGRLLLWGALHGAGEQRFMMAEAA
jgi:hypothetical protein